MHRSSSNQSIRENMNSLVVFGGSSHPELCKDIVSRLGIQPGKVVLGKFSNRETKVQVLESIRDMDVFIIQSGCGNVNDNFMELLIMVSACKIASAAKVTVIIPCFPYARQPDAPHKQRQLAQPPAVHPVATTGVAAPKPPPETPPPKYVTEEGDGGSLYSLPQSGAHTEPKRGAPSHPLSRVEAMGSSDGGGSRSSSPIITTPNALSMARNGYKHWVARSGTLIANMLMAAGTDAVITMDLHDPQFQGFFDIPVDNLRGSPLMIKYIREKIPNYQQALIVSPDAGGAKKATSIANQLGMGFALIHKEHKSYSSCGGQNHHGVGHQGAAQQQPYNMVLVGKVKGRTCILVDDMADTSTTITRAADVLYAKGAVKVYAIITHGILSGDAVQRIQDSKIDELIVSNTVPQSDHIRQCSKIKVFDVAFTFAEAIRRIHNGESISVLFDPPEFYFPSG